jgi:phage baseplate assembly protein W
MTDPLWIDIPLGFDARGRTAGTSYPNHVLDMIEQVLFTTPGERVNRPDFGCGLLTLVFEPNSYELAATLQLSASGALQLWLGDVITVESLEATAEDNVLRVVVRYVILATGERRTDVIEGSVNR